MFLNGSELVQRLQTVLDKIDTGNLGETKDLQPVKLVICDINMPILDGWQTLDKVKELYTQKQAEIDECKVIDNEKGESKVITLQMPYFAFHTATYVDEKMRVRAH